MSDNKSRKKKSTFWSEVLSWLEVILIAAAIAFVVNSFILANSQVPTASMENTIMGGDRVFGSRLAYKFGKDPQRGDVIIFKYPDDESVYFVKRVIGLPGDIVDIADGQVFINGTALEEPYLREPMLTGDTPLHYEVPPDAYFCMGDNRNNSADARFWENTYVYRDKIIAKVLIRYFPSIKVIH